LNQIFPGGLNEQTSVFQFINWQIQNYDSTAKNAFRRDRGNGGKQIVNATGAQSADQSRECRRNATASVWIQPGILRQPIFFQNSEHPLIVRVVNGRLGLEETGAKVWRGLPTSVRSRLGACRCVIDKGTKIVQIYRRFCQKETFKRIANQFIASRPPESFIQSRPAFVADDRSDVFKETHQVLGHLIADAGALQFVLQQIDSQRPIKTDHSDITASIGFLGQAFELLQNKAGMRTVRITDILRQQGDYKRLVELVVAGEMDAAFALMEKMGVVKEMPLAERKIALAQDYVAALEKGETALVVAPTHAERREVTTGIREALKQKGMLKEEKQIKFMQNLSWSNEQKSEPANYRVGMLVEIESPTKGFQSPEWLEVVAVRDDMVRVRSLHPHKTKTMPLPLDMPECFSVGERALETSYQRDILRNLSWTDAQRSDPEHYKPGLVVQINHHVEGFALGEKLEVVMVREDMVKARSLVRGGQVKPLPLSLPAAFSVYERDTIEICKGEHIYITGNGRAVDGRRINNKSSYTVDYITAQGEIVLENGLRLDRKFQHLDYGYAVTSHAAQGRTVDRVLLAQSAVLSYGASDARQFLVSISRGRKGMAFYPDDIEVLKEIVSTEHERPMATEIFQQEKSSVSLGSQTLVEPEAAQEAVQDKSSARLGEEAAMRMPEEIEREMEKEMEPEMEEELEMEL